MKRFRFIFPLTLFASACTFQPQGNTPNAEFHPPLVYQNWQTERYTVKDNAKACAFSSGYNGITVYLVQNGANGETVSIKSNRRMQPGSTFTVNVGGSRFEASDMSFLPASARPLFDRLMVSDKAYLEWAEIAGPTAERIHVQNIVKLDGFAAQVKQCRDSFK